MPTHSHLVQADPIAGSSQSPSGGNLAESATYPDRGPVFANTYTTGAPASPVTLNSATIKPSGGSQPHTNIQPVLALHYIICLYGIFPSRN